MTILFDRSRAISYQRCPRRRYWEYEYDGTGVRQARKSIPLTVGTWVHKGLEVLLNGAKTTGTALGGQSVVEDAVEQALAGYDKDVQDSGLLPQEAGEAVDNYTAQEQRALIEAQIRAYALARLPVLVSDYKIIDVELDELWEDFGPDVGFMFTADALLEDLSTKQHYVQSFKTAAMYDHRRKEDARHDMQGMSELAGILQRDKLAVGVRMEYLIKGARRKNSDGRYVQDSFLVRPWCLYGITAEANQFSWMYQWENDLGQTKRLPKGYSRTPIWEMMPIKEWIDILWEGGANPPGYSGPGPFEAMMSTDDQRVTAFVCPEIYYRSEDDIAEWKESMIAQETDIARKVRLLGSEAIQPSAALPVLFPKYTHSCDWPSKCPYTDLCWGPFDDPLADGLYVRREPHHQAEMNARLEQDASRREE